jgi:acetyltransferase
MTYVIHRYPVHLIDVVQFTEACRVTIRPTLPQDAELQQEFFLRLSAERRYFRFRGALNELPANLVKQFAEIDCQTHLALMAEVFNDRRETMIGEARFVVDLGDPEACEFAIAVADDWQAQGLARALLERLEYQAAILGIRRMVGDTLLTNTAMLRLAEQAGYDIKPSEVAWLARLEKFLTNSHTPLSSRLRAA